MPRPEVKKGRGFSGQGHVDGKKKTALPFGMADMTTVASGGV